MAFMEISIVPIGTGSVSVGEYVAEAVKLLKESGLEFTVSDMGTIIEGTPEELFLIAKKMHESAFLKGSKRVYTVIKMDDRRDRPVHLGQKSKSVEKRIK